MHIGLVIYGALDRRSGGFLYDYEMVHHLQAHGHTIDIISLDWRTYAHHLTDNYDTALFERLHRATYDILLQDELNHPSLFYLNQRLKDGGITYSIVSIVHHLRVSEQHPAALMSLYHTIERRYLNTVDAFIYNSQSTRAAVGQLAPSTASRPHVVALPSGSRFSGLSSATITQHQAPPPLRVVFVGNVTRRKGLHTLLEAVSTFSANDVLLDVVGALDVETDYAKEIYAQIDRYHPSEQVKLWGRLDDNALADVLSRAHVLAVPSQHEGFGIVYLEGMGFGLPPIGTNSGGASEIIQHGENGFLVPPKTPAAIQHHLFELLNQPNMRQRMSHNARASFEQHPTWQTSMASVEAFLQTLHPSHDV